MSIPQPQVTKDHYDIRRYNRKQVWLNYWYQIQAVLKLNPERVLEIGPGNKTVTDLLKKAGVEVVTVDIDAALEPDVLASVTELPFPDGSFDAVLCSEVLEHMPYEQFSSTLKELGRVTKRWIILGLPNAGGIFQLSFKLPFISQINLFSKLPFFWKKHLFNGEHYWETGKKDYQRPKVRKDITSSGFKIAEESIHHDDPAHWILILEKSL